MSPGVRRIEAPLPFSLGTINGYLVQLDPGYLLIDCGMDADECFSALDQGRASAGIEWRDISRILLTHIHPDHMGLAPKLLALTGARLSMHPEDEALLGELADRTNTAAGDAQLTRAGSPPELLSRMNRAFDEVSRSFRRLKADTLLRGGETIPLASGELEVIWTPGHSPGHLCLYDRARGVLFSGDHILEHISPNIGWQPENDPLGEYLDSLQVIANLEVDLILPSHGQPFRGHREWIANAIEHHRERCGVILARVSAEPRTAHELVGELWTRSLSPFHYRFAIYEVLAHLEYMRKRGVIQARENGVTRWSAVSTGR